MLRHLVWLAIGAFAIGTETFVIAALLPSIASDLHVTVAIAGQVVTIFALGYAVGSPVLSVLAGGIDRKWLLVACLLVFTLANVAAAVAQTLPQLSFARILLALSAGLYMPTANAVATTLVAPEKRGRAIAVVVGGMTVAVTFGVPLGALIGAYADWRTTFLMVAVIGAVAALGLTVGLPRGLPRTVSTLTQRLAVGRRPEILHGLAVTLAFATGVFAVFTFLAPLLAQAAGFASQGVSATLFVFGAAAAIGNAAGGHAADRFGPVATVRAGLFVLAIAFAMLGFAATSLPTAPAAIVMVVAVALWGVTGWGLYSAQMANFVRLAPDVSMVALSLNASTFYLGVAAGSALGAFTLSVTTVRDLGWVAAAAQVLALIILQLAPRAAAPLATASAVQPSPRGIE